MKYVRPDLKVRKPKRSFGGADGAVTGHDRGRALRRLAMHSAEDAATAAIRAGYHIVDAQIERGMRIAQEIRGAARRTTAGKPKDVLRSAEVLGGKAVRAIREWLDLLATQPVGPLKRMLTPESRAALASLLGLESTGSSELGVQLLRLLAEDGQRIASGEVPARRPIIAFDGEPRAVELVKWELYGDLADVQPKPLNFARSGGPPATFKGGIARRPGSDELVLTLTLPAKDPEGRWKAAICGADNVMLGVIVVEL